MSIENRNAEAVMQALRNQNEKITKLQSQLQTLGLQLSMLQNQVTAMKEQHLKDLAAQFGSGPTA